MQEERRATMTTRELPMQEYHTYEMSYKSEWKLTLEIAGGIPHIRDVVQVWVKVIISVPHIQDVVQV